MITRGVGGLLLLLRMTGRGCWRRLLGLERKAIGKAKSVKGSKKHETKVYVGLVHGCLCIGVGR